MKKPILIIAFLVFIISGNYEWLNAQPSNEQRHRVIVLTDIEADPDDTQSLVRLLLYSNQIDIKGLVATTSVWKKTSISPETIVKVINAYGEVQSNLNQHEEGYPTEEELLALVKEGLPVYGMKGVGEGKDSEGSEWIIKHLENDDDRPLWISVWGGVNTLAQALYEIRDTYTEKEADEMISKLRVYTISDQDDSGNWIRNNFTNLFYIVSPGDDYGSATWSSINTYVDGINNDEISNRWLAENIQQDHGPLGAVYPDVAWGVEGDTPAYLLLIPNGLNVPDRPDWGGWGGRYEFYQPEFESIGEGGSDVVVKPENREIWTNASDSYTPYMFDNYGRAVEQADTTVTDDKVTLWRWRDDFQNDCAARMDWTTKSYDEANHPPVPVLEGSDQITVQSGESFTLDARNSYDPDGDNLSFLWFHYPEAGSYNELIPVPGAENVYHVNFVAPEVDKPETAHIILEVTDKGKPALSRYKRVVVNILPEE